MSNNNSFYKSIGFILCSIFTIIIIRVCIMQIPTTKDDNMVTKDIYEWYCQNPFANRKGIQYRKQYCNYLCDKYKRNSICCRNSDVVCQTTDITYKDNCNITTEPIECN